MDRRAAEKITGPEPTKKCCRSETRCLSCPVVIMRMRRLEAMGLTGAELRKALKKARAGGVASTTGA